MHFRALTRRLKGKAQKRQYLASDGLGILEIVSEPDTRQCANKEAESRREVDTRRCASEDAEPLRRWIGRVPYRLERETSASKDVGPQKGWIVRSHVGWRGEQNTFYKGVETSL